MSELSLRCFLWLVALWASLDSGMLIETLKLVPFVPEGILLPLWTGIEALSSAASDTSGCSYGASRRTSAFERSVMVPCRSIFWKIKVFPSATRIMSLSPLELSWVVLCSNFSAADRATVAMTLSYDSSALSSSC